MKKIYSKVQKDVLLHCVVTSDDLTKNRLDISPDNEFLQLSGFIIDEGKTYRPHKHIPCEKIVTITQECWVVISGKIKVFHYDLDDTIINEEILNPGDITITFRGGHNYLCLENNSKIYEFKTGPYFGQENDKVFI